MLRTALLLVLFTAPLSAAPSSKAAQKADYDTVCNALERSGAKADKDASARAMKVAEYIQKHLKTPEVRKLMGDLASELPENRGPRLKSEAAKVGYKGRCPLVDDKE